MPIRRAGLRAGIFLTAMFTAAPANWWQLPNCKHFGVLKFIL